MRAASVTFAVVVTLACSGEPFTMWSSSEGGGAPPDLGGSGGAGGLVEPSHPTGAGTGASPGRGEAGGGKTSDEPEAQASGAAGAPGGTPAGGEGGGAAEPSCPGQATSDWEVGYFPELREVSAQESHPFFQATNGGQTTTLDRIAIRYYFTNDSGSAETASCYWVTGDHCSLAKLTFGDVPSPTAVASRYLEVSFPSGSAVKVTPGKLEVRVGFKTGSAPNLQTNDYSFDPNAATPSGATPFPYKRWPQATLYLDGKLVWGSEPCDSAPEVAR